MPDVHAKLSASGAHRWMACPGSYSLEKDIPDKSSEAAQEGTVAHSLAEAMIKYNSGAIRKTEFNRKYKAIKESQYYCTEMDDCIRSYANQVWMQFWSLSRDSTSLSTCLEALAQAMWSSLQTECCRSLTLNTEKESGLML